MGLATRTVDGNDNWEQRVDLKADSRLTNHEEMAVWRRGVTLDDKTGRRGSKSTPPELWGAGFAAPLAPKPLQYSYIFVSERSEPETLSPPNKPFGYLPSGDVLFSCRCIRHNAVLRRGS